LNAEAAEDLEAGTTLGHGAWKWSGGRSLSELDKIDSHRRLRQGDPHGCPFRAVIAGVAHPDLRSAVPLDQAIHRKAGPAEEAAHLRMLPGAHHRNDVVVLWHHLRRDPYRPGQRDAAEAVARRLLEQNVALPGEYGV